MYKTSILLLLACTHSAFAVWTCTQNSDCAAVEGSVCTNGECVCPVASQIVLGGSRCANHAPYYTSPCYDDFQCARLFSNFECRRPENSTTSEAGQCDCQPNHHYFHGRCWPSSDWGQECTRDEECFNDLRDPFSMSCQDGICACSEGYYLRQRGECRKSGLAVGDACVIDEDCQFAGGSCENFECIKENSANKKLPSPSALAKSSIMEEEASSSSTAVSTRQHGGVCDLNNPCPSPFLCSSLGVCICPVGYYPNAAGTVCLAEIGSPVTSPEQCVGFFMEVRDGVCQCWTNFYVDKTMRGCVRATVRPGDSCVIDQHCHTFGMFSRCGPPGQWELRTCECTPGITVWNANRQICALFGGIGELCEVDSDCIAGDMEIECVQSEEGYGVCTCPQGYQAVGDLCLLLGQELGEECQVDLECASTEHAQCVDSKCVCGGNYQQVDNYCGPVIGGTCQADADCLTENTVCDAQTGTCNCGQSYVNFDGSCWPGTHVWTANWTKGEDHTASLTLTHDYRIMDYNLFHIDAEVTQNGPGHVRLLLHTSFGPLLVSQSVTPLSAMCQKVVHRVFSPWYDALVGSIMVMTEAYMFERDVAIWNNKIFVGAPTYVKSDKSIRAFRAWFSQFYSEHSKSFREAIQNPIDW